MKTGPIDFGENTESSQVQDFVLSCTTAAPLRRTFRPKLLKGTKETEDDQESPKKGLRRKLLL
jgi:hypothetical protein